MKENCNTCDPCEEKGAGRFFRRRKQKRQITAHAKTATKLSLRENKLTGPKQKKKERFHVPFSFEPQVGLEPTTFSLRMKCSTDWAIVANPNDRAPTTGFSECKFRKINRIIRKILRLFYLATALFPEKSEKRRPTIVYPTRSFAIRPTISAT